MEGIGPGPLLFKGLAANIVEQGPTTMQATSIWSSRRITFSRTFWACSSLIPVARVGATLSGKPPPDDGGPLLLGRLGELTAYAARDPAAAHGVESDRNEHPVTWAGGPGTEDPRLAGLLRDAGRLTHRMNHFAFGGLRRYKPRPDA